MDTKHKRLRFMVIIHLIRFSFLFFFCAEGSAPSESSSLWVWSRLDGIAGVQYKRVLLLRLERRLHHLTGLSFFKVTKH